MTALWTPSRRVPVGRFRDGAWRDADEADVDRDEADVDRDELTVTTFNVWFEEHHAVPRFRAIAALLAETSPDLLAFQEVTPQSLGVLLSRPWVRRHYRRAAVVGGRVGNYGMALLSRLPLRRVEYARWPTRFDRGVLRAEVDVGGTPLTVCSIHLNSGKERHRLRAVQLRRIYRAVGGEDAVVLGDFNMRDREDHRIVAPLRDVWPLLHPSEPGYTEDTDINLMRWDSKPKPRQVRFDRVLVAGERWQPADITLLGTAPISADLPRVFPSDHFGLLCRLRRRAPA